MVKAEIKRCVKAAMDPAQYEAERVQAALIGRTDGDDWWDLFYGIGLPGAGTRYVTVGAAARFLRYQCLQLNGQWDHEELDACCRLLERRAVLVD